MPKLFKTDVASAANLKVFVTDIRSEADLVIYELHVRDFTVDKASGIQAAGRYAGIAERGTRVPETDASTGLDHLLELGVNAVQIMPIHEFAKDPRHPYNWGYMPILFAAPESSYAANPREGSQIAELREPTATRESVINPACLGMP